MKRTRLILSVVGIAAVIIPAILLVVFSAKDKKQPNVSTSSRQINPSTVEEAVGKYPKPAPSLTSSSSPSAKPNVGASSSAR